MGSQHNCTKKVRNEIKKCNFDLLILPPNTTSHIQPLDIGVNRSFKAHYARRWDDWMDGKKEISIEKPHRDNTVKWISKGWDLVEPSTAFASWNTYREFAEAAAPETRKEALVELESSERAEREERGEQEQCHLTATG